MKRVCFFCLLYCTLSVNGIGQKLMLLNGIANEQQPVLLPAIQGQWFFKAFDFTVTIQKAGDNFYRLSYRQQQSTKAFEAIFIPAGKEWLLDLMPVNTDSVKDDFYDDHLLRLHSLYKVYQAKDTLMLAEADYQWFFKYVQQQGNTLKFEKTSNGLLLTNSKDELYQFFTNHYHEEGMFSKPAVFLRQTDHTTGNLLLTDEHFSPPQIWKGDCNPVFPWNDGWLGADGDVMVPLSDTSRLFLFSDSYVGMKGSKSRTDPGLHMVSNSVGVQSCLGPTTTVHYYWNNMYDEKPEPIFKSYTDRYRYWVSDAWMYDHALYVLLNKVGPGAGNPDDIFNFTLLGFTMAKVNNPADPPVNWNIELLPMPGFAPPATDITAHAVKDGYIYFFVNHEQREQFLVRKKLGQLENWKEPYEYYAKNKIWKQGIEIKDMDTLVKGFRATSVTYHPSLKQWVMLVDVQFMTNQLFIRTAPGPEGPWSDKKLVYECPETTPGNPLFSKNNFCYLPRECSSEKDKQQHRMVITYDINNSSFEEIAKNPYIYTPKVITIDLKKISINKR